MIGLLMVYTLLVGAVMFAAATMIERIAIARAWPTRGIWALLVAAMMMSSVVAGWHQLRAPAPSQTAPGYAETTVTAQRAGTVRSATVTATKSWQSVLTKVASARQWMNKREPLLDSWNRQLVTAWILSSVCCAALVMIALVNNSRRRSTYHRMTVGDASVLVTDATGPAVVGVRKSDILLPKWALQLEDSLLCLVLRHEQEHVLARDPALLMTGLLAIVVMPWHLPLWRAWRRLRLAVEIDCDARVLRAYPDVRRYAELLLLTSAKTGARSRRPADFFGAVPVHFVASQLARRIHVMTERKHAMSPMRSLLIISAICAVTSVAYAIPSPRGVHASSVRVVARGSDDHETRSSADRANSVVRSDDRSLSDTVSRGNSHETISHARRDAVVGRVRSSATVSGAVTASAIKLKQVRAVVHLNSVELAGAPADSHGLLGEILIYADGPARIALGVGELTVLRDTLRLKTLPAITADVTDSDVHIELVGGGSMSLSGPVTGGPALNFGATGRHIVLMQGGYGIASRPPSLEQLMQQLLLLFASSSAVHN